MSLQYRIAGSSVPHSVIEAATDIKAGIADQLFELLSEIEHSGSFLTSQSCLSAVFPGLHIPGIGQIRLPLSPDDAKAIIQLCHASPFGKGSETVIDDSVRKSWELNTNQFSIQNPSWKLQVNVLVQRAAEGLGLFACPEDIVAEPYKLLLYEDGAFFLPHQDSPKAEGMFGTLVICLPSQHTGGEAIATHKGERKVFETAPSSQFGFSSAAWYSDVTQVKPATSGYRIVLTYNLIHRPTAAQLAIRDNAPAKIASVFDHWESTCKNAYQKFTGARDWRTASWCPSSLLFMLDHQYHSAGLSFTQLKGVDQARVAELRKVCKGKGFYLYLANVTKTVLGSIDDDDGYGYGYYGGNSDGHRSITDEIDTDISLSTVVDCDGHTVADSVGVDEEFFIQEDFLMTLQMKSRTRDSLVMKVLLGLTYIAKRYV